MSFTKQPGSSPEPHCYHKQTILTLYTAALRNLDNVRDPSLGDCSRFELAYIAIIQIANAALLLRGDRALTSDYAIQQGLIESLATSLEVGRESLARLKRLQKLHLIVERSDEQVSQIAVMSCVREAESLLSLLGDQLER